jgi:hypothetical protein
MDKLAADLKKIGVQIDMSAPDFSVSRLSQTVNSVCHKFAADQAPDAKTKLFPQYFADKTKEENGGSADVVNARFSSVIVTCKKNYKTHREMKLFLRLLEQQPHSNKRSVICYMKLRKAVLEGMGKSNDHSIPLGECTTTFELLEQICTKLDLKFADIKADLAANGIKSNPLSAVEVALSVLKAFPAEKQATASAPAPAPAQKAAPEPAKLSASAVTAGVAQGGLITEKTAKHLTELLEDASDNSRRIIKDFFKVMCDMTCNKEITGAVAVEKYEYTFFKYILRKSGENLSAVCKALVDDMSNRAPDKKVLPQMIRLLQANTKHLLSKIAKTDVNKMDDSARKDHHDLCISFYIREFVKKMCMEKYSFVYQDDAEKFLSEGFEKNQAVDKPTLDGINAIEKTLKQFMTDKRLKRRFFLTQMKNLR